MARIFTIVFFTLLETLVRRKNLISIGMDGPSVNVKFHEELETEFEEDNHSLISVGSCPIHVANNAFLKLLEILDECGVKLDQIAQDFHGFFSHSAARRIEYTEAAKSPMSQRNS